MTTNIRQLVHLSPSQLAGSGGQQEVDYMLDRPPFTRYHWNGTAFNPALNADGNIETADGAIYTLSEVTDYVTLTATGSAFSGACEFGGWYCSVAVGNITVYDALSATGTAIVPTQALTVGPLPIFGPGTNGKLKLTTGCWVVLTGAATVRMLVTGA